MGWTEAPKPRGMTMTEFLIKESAEWWPNHVVEYVSKKRVTFTLARFTAADADFKPLSDIFEVNDKGEIFTIVVLKHENFGKHVRFTEMYEAHGPFGNSVLAPASLINRASPIKAGDDGFRKYARDWRKRSLEAATRLAGDIKTTSACGVKAPTKPFTRHKAQT